MHSLMQRSFKTTQSHATHVRCSWVAPQASAPLPAQAGQDPRTDSPSNAGSGRGRGPGAGRSSSLHSQDVFLFNCISPGHFLVSQTSEAGTWPGLVVFHAGGGSLDLHPYDPGGRILGFQPCSTPSQPCDLEILVPPPDAVDVWSLRILGGRGQACCSLPHSTQDSPTDKADLPRCPPC